MMKYFKWIGIVLTVVVTALVIYVKYLPPSQAHVTIINKSSENVISCSVDLCGELEKIENLKPNSDRKIKLDINHDCHYVVKVVFESGKELSNEFGYVTHGVDNYAEILISNNVISLFKNESK